MCWPIVTTYQIESGTESNIKCMMITYRNSDLQDVELYNSGIYIHSGCAQVYDRNNKGSICDNGIAITMITIMPNVTLIIGNALIEVLYPANLPLGNKKRKPFYGTGPIAPKMCYSKNKIKGFV